MEARLHRYSTVYLLGIIATALVLRVFGLGRASMWLDEAISYHATFLPVTALLQNSLYDPHPPLYYLLLTFWRGSVPDTDAALRLLSLFWNLALIPLLYLLGASLFSRRAGIAAALLVAVSPFHLLYSHELRMYTQFMSLIVLGAWAYWHSLHNGGRTWWIVALVAFTAAVYTHLFALPLLGSIFLHGLFIAQGSENRYRAVLLATLPALLFLPWGLLMLGPTQRSQGSLRPLSHIPTGEPLKPLTDLTFLAFGMADQPFYVGVALFFTLALFVLLLVALRRAPSEDRPALALLWLLVAAALSPLLAYAVRPFFLPARTLAAASPFWLLLWAWGFTQRRTPLPYLVGLAAVTLASGSILYLTADPVKPPYGEATALIVEAMQPGDAVLHTSDGSYLPALRYAELPKHGLLVGDPDPRKPRSVYEAFGGMLWTKEEAVSAGQRLWLVVAFEHSLDWQQQQLAWFDDRYPRLQDEDVEGIIIVLYDVSVP